MQRAAETVVRIISTTFLKAPSLTRTANRLPTCQAQTAPGLFSENLKMAARTRIYKVAFAAPSAELGELQRAAAETLLLRAGVTARPRRLDVLLQQVDAVY